eukprot:CAMPEP_0179257960 /NCGR_PEP_ID=MMETSP0797-20121207/25066_1 /TAXON_ID=47934 /ORGANISM="Dinophysis acuminata, Strain DAEP01" /LENGTH=287 /DNA_ID=CAMNT_0020965971 /DNA_START=22 /DNA_END=881 /DNA_ORIENTATION=-
MSNDKSSKYVHRAARSERRRGGAAAAPRGWASSLPLPEEAQHAQEELDDVEVDVQRREHVVVDAELVRLVLAADDHLRVVDGVDDEDQEPDKVVEHDTPLDGDAEGPEGAEDEAPARERHRGAEEHGPEPREVRLRLEREDREPEEGPGGHAGAEHDALPREARGREADEDRLEDGEREEQHVVHGVGARRVLAAHHGADAHQRRDDRQAEEPGLALQLHRAQELEGRGDEAGHDELRGEEAVDLPHEPEADRRVRVLQQGRGGGPICIPAVPASMSTGIAMSSPGV